MKRRGQFSEKKIVEKKEGGGFSFMGAWDFLLVFFFIRRRLAFW